MGDSKQTLKSDNGLEQCFAKACSTAPVGVKVIAQNTQRVEPYDELFYAPVSVKNKFQMRGMLDSGSMACTLSEEAEKKMLIENVLSEPKQMDEEVVLVGCGGKLTKPKCMYKVELKVYGESCIVLALVLPGQRDDLIIGTNVIKFLIHQLKNSDDYWRLIANNSLASSPESEQFLDLMANTSRWRGEELPNKIGTVKLRQSVILLARQEHLVWGKLPKDTPMSPGSTVIVEPTSSKSMPRNIMVGHVVTLLWGDRWVPMKVTNLSDRPIRLKRNCKLADVSPCLAVEDFEVFQGSSKVEKVAPEEHAASTDFSDLEQRLRDVGLRDFDINRKQRVRLGKLVSESRSISTGAPQGCVLSPLLFSLYTNNCTSSHPSVKFLKFADDTTLIGLISNGDEAAYREEVNSLASWCSQNHLELNALKTVEMVADFRRSPA